MKSELCEKLGIEFPLFAFSHCRDVVVEVSKAGGFGCLGATGHTPESLEIELNWIDEHINGMPYGVDLLLPNKLNSKEEAQTAEQIEAAIPDEHRRYIESILANHNIDTNGLWDRKIGDHHGDNLREVGASPVLDVAFAHSGCRMIVNALGVPPDFMREKAKAAGVMVGALAGSKVHAVKHAEAGVDVIIVSGTEAGGHCGEISTMVVVPEVIAALKPHGNVPVLAAGGIASGKQMAAAMTMGAAGAWCGSVWLTTVEAETAPAVKEKMLVATSRNTVRSRSRTGKYTRQLQSAWTDAWHDENAPDPLPMPLQQIISEPALGRIGQLAEGGHGGAKQLATYFVGQAVGLMNATTSTRQVVFDFKEDFAEACERLSDLMSE
ncbi:MAG TPA: nitronate monooxygenase [Arenicellales bacterium]|jgi:NAD(P)H-dependent flavin oxidoreductase YrpB (nitropropane dioxygenase family)|nr:monooxygenase [Nitrospinota bacterium]MDP6025082.1 nitronate monooxygenase [Pseudomonadales bacterium]HJL52452.1 nitronate monooxygenase [Arenicellales bacterium]HJP50388.1 nitronate monooxygenase [Pseudomonadales bacterium]|tara:strand:- start:1698 stop:2837 length:1140 start_codon:yes stop_codon:yes gene_type:complete